MQEVLQHLFHTVPTEGLLGNTWLFILDILGWVLFFGLMVGLVITFIQILFNINRDRQRSYYIYKPFSRIVQKIESRANFFKKGIFLVLPAGAVFVASIVLMLYGLELIGHNENVNFDVLCTVGLLMFLASFIYFTVLYFHRGNYAALVGFYENRTKEYLPPEWEITDYYEDDRYVRSTSRNLNTMENVGRGIENVMIIAVNVGTFISNIVLFIVVNLFKAVWKIVETPFCLNLKAKAQKKLKKWLFSQEKRATDIITSTNPTRALPHSKLEYQLFYDAIGDVVFALIDKVRAREDEIDIIFDSKTNNPDHNWSDEYLYYHTKKLIGEYTNSNGDKELIYETNLGILFIGDPKGNAAPVVCMFVPFLPTNNWMKQYNSLETGYKNCARVMESRYLAYKKATDSPDKEVTVLYYEKEEQYASTDAIVVSAKLANITMNENGLFGVTQYTKVKLKNGSAGSGGDGNTAAVTGFILSFFMPFAGLIFSIIGLMDAKKKGLPHKGLAIAGIVISLIMCFPLGLLIKP